MSESEALKALRERVERAEGADREIDARLQAMKRGQSLRESGNNIWIEDARLGERLLGTIDPGKHQRNFSIYDTSTPTYTASLDAAISLVEKMLPDAFWELDQGYNATITDADAGYCGSAHGKPTPALALIAALLKALEARNG